MKDLIKNRIFIIGLIAGIFVFIIRNYREYSLEIMINCADCGRGFGFPFYFYQEGGLVPIKKILWLGLVGDLAFAIIFSLTIGLICNFIWSKFSSQKLK